MTAMPPTKGHRNLVRFARELCNDVNVIVCTQPGEPYAFQRYEAVAEAFKGDYSIHVVNLHKEIMQDPSVNGFWEMWDEIMWSHGAQPGDYYVSSEPYGATLAKRLNGVFFPYDPGRELYYTKATNIREKLDEYFDDILPEFQRNVRTNVVIFGAESTGKTTLSKELAASLNGHWFFEWARPYLETVGPDINEFSMKQIWMGQRALQDSTDYFYDKPYAIFDTDLFSTVGYWEQPHWEKELGPVPDGLVFDAKARMADLYIITKSNIPFEQDPIRYGGDHRESPDQYWIDLADKYRLPYVVLEEDGLIERVSRAGAIAKGMMKEKADKIYYDRKGL